MTSAGAGVKYTGSLWLYAIVVFVVVVDIGVVAVGAAMVAGVAVELHMMDGLAGVGKRVGRS